jgi:hypothetical protein
MHAKDTSMIQDLDMKDSKQKRLAGFSARLVKLLERPEVQSNEQLASVLDDLLGALYALIAARQEAFAEGQDPLQALGLGGPHKPLGKRVQIWTPGRQDQWLHATVPQ